MVKAQVVRTPQFGWRFRVKLVIAIILDALDFLFAPIPLINSLWDIMTAGVLFLILKNKSWASYSLGELALPAIPGFNLVDMFIPVATITVVLDELR